MRIFVLALFVTTFGLVLPGSGSATRPPDQLLLTDSSGRVAAIDVATGRLRLLGRGWEATWSPTGRRIAFTRGDLFVIASDGSGARRLTRDDLVQHGAVWSPDGTRIALLQQHPGTGRLASPPRDDVAVVDLGTDRVRQLTYDASGKIRLSWSPDGAKLVYEVSRGPANLSLASIDADTGLATEPESVRPYPIWSPSGRRLAFVVIENERASLTIAAAGGTAARVVFRGARDVGVDGVTWSPNGRFLSFSYGGWSRSRRRLELIDTRTGRVRSLTGVMNVDSSPSWSVDSMRLAFERYEPRARRYAVAIVDRRNGRVHVLARSKQPLGSPQWRPRAH